MGIAMPCRGAMGIAAGVGARRPEPRSLRCLRARTRRPTFLPGDRPSGCFSSQYRQKPLRIEIPDAKRQIHRAFARSAAAGLPAGGP
jgi:hypothetical protein